MTVETRFGAFEASERDIIAMAQPVPGFEQCRRFVALSASAIAPFTCLQGLDGARPSFLALDPRRVDATFHCDLSDDDRARLECGTDAALLWLALVTVTEQEATINLRAPIVINPARMIGLQVIPVESAYATATPLPPG